MPASMLLFLGVFLLVMGGIHLFLHRRLVRGLGITSPRLRRALALLAALLAVSYPVARWLEVFAPDGVVFVAQAVAGIWFGLMFHLLWLGLVVWLLGQGLRLVGRRPRSGRLAVVVVAALAVALCIVGWFGAHADARVREVEVPVKGFTEALGDLRIAVVADLHAGMLVDEAEVRRRVGEVRALEPDLILIPGDILDSPVERLPWLVDALAGLDAPLGVFTSTGNHEYYAGRDAGVALLEKAGIRVLVNERVDLPGGLLVAGIEDRTARAFDRSVPSEIAILGPEAATRPTLFLNHTPATAASKAAIAAGADLVVSGHTHGGQIWPFSLLTQLAFRYHHGLYAVGRGHQLTTCGIGWWGPPMRLGTAPEIVLVRLVGLRSR